MNDVIWHYDKLIEEDNDPVHDSEPLRSYMDKWDGQAFIDELQLSSDKSVLEIGVGTGKLATKTVPLCGYFTGIDISPKTIERAKENLSMYSNIALYCGDFLVYSFSHPYDIIYSSLTFMHIANKQVAINKAAQSLKSNGIFVLSIDKNQSEYIDMGNRKIKIYPDDKNIIGEYIKSAGLLLEKQIEVEFAYIFKGIKQP